MSQPRDDRQDDLFRPALEKIIDLRHPLVRARGGNRLGFSDEALQFGMSGGAGAAAAADEAGGGLFILKHMHNLSDEVLCDRWVENPFFQYFCGEVVFRHEAPVDRSPLTRWRQAGRGAHHRAAARKPFGGNAPVRLRSKISSRWP